MPNSYDALLSQLPPAQASAAPLSPAEEAAAPLPPEPEGLTGQMELTGTGGLEGTLRRESGPELQGTLERTGTGGLGGDLQKKDYSGLLSQLPSDGQVYDPAEDMERRGEFLRWRVANETRAPEEQAEILRLSAALGWAPEVVAGDLPKARNMVEAEGLDVAAVLQAHPALAQFLGDPETSALARSDTARLTGLAYLIGEGKVPGAFEQWWNQRQLTRELNDLQRQHMDGTVEDADLPPSYVDQGDAGVMEVPGTREMTAEERAALAAKIDAKNAELQKLQASGDGVEELAFGARHLAKTARLLIGMGPEMVKGAAVGALAQVVAPVPGSGIAAGTAFWAWEQAPMLYWQLHSLQDASGKPMLSDEQARSWALAGSIPLGLANAVTLEGMGASFTKWATSKPAVEVVLSKLAPATVERVLAKRGMGAVLGKAAANYGSHVLQGGLMMGAQSGLTQATLEAASATHGGDFRAGAVAESFADGFVTGMEDFAILSAWGPARKMLADRGRLAASVESARWLKDVAENTKESKLAQRDPARFGELLNRFGPEKKVYVELEFWDELAQEKKVSPRELAAKVFGDNGETYDAAKSAGADLAFPVGTWAEKIVLSKEGLAEKLAPHSRANLSELTPFRIMEGEKALQEKLQKDAEARGPAFEFEQRTLRDRLHEAARSVGHERRVADAWAAKLHDYVSYVALETGTTLREALVRTGLPKLKLEGQDAVFNALAKDFKLTREELAEVEKVAPLALRPKVEKPKGVTVSARVAEAKQEVIKHLPDLGESALNDIRLAKEAAKTPEAAAAVERLARAAYLDTLTPAGNKNAYLDFLARPREGVHVAIDLNDFKNINDTLGHDAGDKAIGTAGGAFSQASRANRGKLFRNGGDEFHAYFESAEQARAFIEQAKGAFDALGPVAEGQRLSFSAGVGRTPEEADLASMDAKAAKREKYGDVRQGNAKPGHGESFVSFAEEVRTREAVVEAVALDAAVPEPRSQPNPRAVKVLDDRFESWLRAKLSEDGHGVVLEVEITDDHRINLWPDFIEDVKATDPDLLMAYWGSSAESKGATYFASGSNDPGEIRGMARSGQHVGVAVPAVSAKGMAALKALRGLDIRVFADSGAFGEVEKGFPFATKKAITHEEWVKRLGKYKELAQELGSQLYVVAPDRVARQTLTLERLKTYAKEMRELRALGANIIVPLQRAFGPDGETMSTAQFFAEAKKALGMDDIIAGIPSKKAASTVEDIAAFVAEARPERVHLLGLGTKAAGGRFEKVINAIANASPETKVFADSVMLASMKVTGRGSFTDMKNEYKRLGMKPGADLNEAATQEAVGKRQSGGESRAASDLKADLKWTRADTIRDAMRRSGLVPTEPELEAVAHEPKADPPYETGDELEQVRRLGSREQRARETAKSAGEAEAMRTTRDWKAPVAAKRFEKMYPSPKVAGRVLDFGSGREARAQQRLLGLGYDIDAHDLWAVRDPEVAALGLHLSEKEFAKRAGTYDTVVSSNVVNVQGDQQMMDAYLSDVKLAMKDRGVFIANLPETPRKGWYAEGDLKAQNAQLKAELQKHFREVEQTGPTNNPVYVARKPIRDVAPAPKPVETAQSPKVRSAFDAVRASLRIEDLDRERQKQYAGKSPLHGQCSNATNALYHLLGGADGQWEERMINRVHLGGEDTHYFLRHKESGEILDPTAEQFEGQPIPYERSRGAGRQQPGKFQGQPLKAVQGLLYRARAALPDDLRQDSRGTMKFKVGESGRPRDFDIYALKGDKSTLAHETMHWMSWSMHDLAMRADSSPGLRGDYETLLKFGGWKDAAERLSDNLLRAKLRAVKNPTAGQLDTLRELRAKEERLTHAWEQYLMEGVAPNAGLRTTFQRFRRWMSDLYGSVQGIDKQYFDSYGQHIELSDEVRGVFNRMMNVDREVGRQQADSRVYDLGGILDLSPEELGRQEKLHELSAQAARAHLDEVAAKADAEELSGVLGTERERLRAEVYDEVSATKPYVAMDFLASGELRDPETGRIFAAEKLPAGLRGDDGGPLRLSYDDAKRVAGKDAADAARRKGLTAEKGGASADELADLLGFTDGKELVETVASAPEKDAVVELETKNRFEKAFAPKLHETADALHAVGNDAIHNPHEIDRLLHLRDVLARQMSLPAKGGGRLPKDVLVRNVRRMMRETFVKDISPKWHLDAERRAAKKAFEAATEAKRALENGKVEEADRLYAVALHEHDNVILNKLQWREATKMLRELEKAQLKMERSVKTTWAQRLGKTDIVYADGTDAIFAALGFKEGHENATPARFEEMLAKMKEDGGEVIAMPPDPEEAVVPGAGPRDAVLEAALWDSQSIRRLLRAPSDWQHVRAVEALNALDAIDNIRATAASKLKLKIGEKRETRESLIAATAASMEGRLKTSGEPVAKGALNVAQRALLKLKTGAAGIDANMTELEGLVNRITGDDHQHPLYQLFVIERQKARLEELKLGQAFGARITRMWQDLPKELQKGKHDIIPGLVDELPVDSHGGILNPKSPRDRSWMWMVALNLGNEGNLQRLLDGTGWEESQVRSALQRHMTAAEWRWVQGVWDSLADLYPHIERVHIADTGLRPDKVRAKALKVLTADGQELELAGGYFPARYDPRIPSKSGVSEKQEATSVEGLVSPSFRPPRLVTDHVHARAAKNGDLLNLDFGVVPSHVQQVVHYVSHQQYLKQVAGLVLDPRFKELIRGKMGIEYEKQFPAWVRAVANQFTYTAADSMTVPNGILSWAKSRATLAAVGFNVSVPLADLTNPLLPVLGGDLSPLHLARATREVAGNWSERRAFALANSTELQLRANHGTSLGIDVEKVVRSKGTLGEIEHAAYWMMETSDRMTATPIWLAKYAELLEKDVKPEIAGQEADALVRKYFPSSDPASRAAWLRDRGAWGYLTFLYGFGSKVYNINRATITHAVDSVREPGRSTGSKAQAVGVALGVLLAQGLVIGGVADFVSGHGPKEDKEGWGEWAEERALQYVQYQLPWMNLFTGGRGALPATGLFKKLKNEALSTVTLENGPLESIVTLGGLAVGGAGFNQLNRTAHYTDEGLVEDVYRGRYRRAASNLLYGDKGVVTPFNIGADK